RLPNMLCSSCSNWVSPLSTISDENRPSFCWRLSSRRRKAAALPLMVASASRSDTACRAMRCSRTTSVTLHCRGCVHCTRSVRPWWRVSRLAATGSCASTALIKASTGALRAEIRSGFMAIPLLTSMPAASMTGQGFEADMDGAHATHHIMVAAALKASVLHHALQGFLVRMHADGLHQIAVTGRVARHQLAHHRPQSRITIIGLAHQRVARLGELQHQGAAARFEYVKHGAKRRVLVGDIAQAIGDTDAVKAVRRKRQLLGVDLGVGDIAGNALVDQPVAADTQHGIVDIGQHHMAVIADK